MPDPQADYSLVQQLLMAGERNPFVPMPSEEQSGADRLRPPYPTPVPGAQPVTAGAATNTEVGFGGLPPAYQRALLQSPLMRTLIGQMPQGYNVQGETNKTRGTMVADSPQTMTHELVHELLRRLGHVLPKGETISRSGEEELARLVAGNPSGVGMREYGGYGPEARKGAEQAHQEFMAAPAAPAMGLLQFIQRLLGRP